VLDRVSNWQHYLSNYNTGDCDLISLHSRTGRPLGSDSFVQKLEDICGKPLAPKKPGRNTNKDRN
jgi:putative transposase